MKRSKPLVGAVVVLASAATMTGVGPAAADGPVTSGGNSVPLAMTFRSCDHAVVQYVSASGSGSGSALIGRTGANQVIAVVNLQTAEPDTRYTVRLIQVPRPADRTCFEGDPGVAVGALFTDGNGTGSTTVQGPLAPGATGAWVAVDGPPPPGKVIGEFYTTELARPVA
jgi:hypothetical protein